MKAQLAWRPALPWICLAGLYLVLTRPFADGADAQAGDSRSGMVPLRPSLTADQRLTAHLANTNLATALLMYQELTGRTLLPATNTLSRTLDNMSAGRLSRWRILRPANAPDSGLTFHGDGFYSAGEVKTHLEALFKTNGLVMIPSGSHGFRAVRLLDMGVTNGDQALAAQRFLAGARARRVRFYLALVSCAALAGAVALVLTRRSRASVIQNP